MLNNNDFISVQQADFDVAQHYTHLTAIQPGGTGAVVLFSGLVRDLQDAKIAAMELEYYPGMTEASLQKIVLQAREKWPLIGVRLVHRFGKLLRHDQIVLVGVAAGHRKDAFAACEFIMDYLKQDAPFWKAEITNDGEKHWVDAKQSDQQANKRWG